MEHAIQFMAGICYFVLGISFLFRHAEWVAWMGHIKKEGKRASLSIGAINLLVGTFIVAFHPVWTGIPVVLTIFGVIGVIKGFVYLVFPQWLPAKIDYLTKCMKPMIKIIGVVLLIFSVALINEGMTGQLNSNWDQYFYLGQN